MFKKSVIYSLVLVFSLVPSVGARETVSVEEFDGLYTNPSADKIPNGAHSVFQNVYIRDGNIQSIKGRDKINTSALTDTTLRGLTYYEARSSFGESATAEVMTHLNGSDGDTDVTNSAITGDVTITTSNGAEKDTAQKKFGTASMLFDGTNDNLTLFNDSDELLFEDENFTIDFWVRFASDPSGSNDQTFFEKCQATSINENNQKGVWQLYYNKDDTLHFRNIDDGNVEIDISNTWNPPADNWEHVAITKDSSNTYRMFINGSQIGSDSSDDSPINETMQENTRIGEKCAAGGQGGNLNGWMDEIRVDKGTAYWTSDFTAPSSEHTVENSGSVQKIISVDKDEMVCMNLDGSNRTVIASGLTGSGDWTFTQVGSALYANNESNGQYKWFGDCSSSASAKSNPPDHPYVENYKGVIFSAKDHNLRFSSDVGTNETTDETWSSSDHIVVGSPSHDVTGLQRTRDSLLIFTDASIQELTGFGASTFRLRNSVVGIGAVSDETIEPDSNGDVIFLAGKNGVFKLNVGKQLTDSNDDALIGRSNTTIEKLSEPLDDVFLGTDSNISLTISDYKDAHAYYDLQQDLYHLYIGSDEFIYDNINQSWTHVPGSKMVGSIYVQSFIDESDSGGILQDNRGFLYENWTGYDMGVESGTVTGNPTGSTGNTLTDSGASFNTTDDGLEGNWVFLDAETDQFRQITSNTSTKVTVNNNWDVNPFKDDTYYISYLPIKIRTKQYNLGSLPNKTSLENFWIIHEQSNSTQDLDILAFRNKEENAISADTVDLNNSDHVHKVDLPVGGFTGRWIEYLFRSFVYNTSDNVNPPVEIITYALDGEVKEV